MKTVRMMLFVGVIVALLLTACGGPAPAATTAPPAANPTAPAVPPTEVVAPATEVPPPPTEAPPPPAEPQTLIIAMDTADLITLDPAVAGESTNQFIHANVYDTLLEYKAPDYYTPIPRLADSWEVSSDGKTWTFNLKQGVTFSSGNPVTADDVVFSWLRDKYMAVNGMFSIVDNVEAVDPNTVKVTLSAPAADFLPMVSHPGWGILDSVVVKAHGGVATPDTATADTAKLWLDQNSAGSAAYILTKWAPKAEVDMEVNPNYRGEKPFFDKVIIKDASDPTATLQMLQTGDADIVPYVDINLDEQAKSDPNLQVFVNQSQDTYYFAMTSKCTTEVSPETAAILCKPDVRKAIANAIDYDGLIKQILKGYGLHAPAILPIGMSVIDPALGPKYDVAKAKEYLTKAGYANGFTMDLTYNSNPQRDTIAAKIKNDLAAVGITANLKPLETTVYLTQMRAQQLPVGFGGWTPDYLDPTLWTDNYSCLDLQIAHRMWYDSKAACDLGHQIKSELDTTKRQQEITQLQQIWLDDMPFFNLYQPQYISAMNKDIKGFVYHPARFMDLAALSK